MKRTLTIAVLSLAGYVGAAPPDAGPITGHWSGQLEGLPAIRLTVSDEGGKLMGAVLFYLIRRNPQAAPTASPGFPEPLIDPKFDGKVLRFQVSHRYAHPPATLHDPPVSFRLELMGAGRAKLTGAEAPPLELVREQY